ncbi:MAG: hypothetical protein MJ187_04660 [Alphaproteobacteria bacterium]|nr:hypothetical protein [Alphaproteobacteria bacterium]
MIQRKRFYPQSEKYRLNIERVQRQADMYTIKQKQKLVVKLLNNIKENPDMRHSEIVNGILENERLGYKSKIVMFHELLEEGFFRRSINNIFASMENKVH